MTIPFYIPWKKFIFFLIAIVGISNNRVAAQIEDTAQNPLRTDSNYIADYKELLTARVFLLYEDATFVIIPGSAKEISYYPNVSGRIGLAGFYKWFGLGLSLGNSILRRSTTTYGKTSVLDLRINFYGRSAAGELYLQNLKGFYIQDTKDPFGNFYKIPDMRFFSIGLTGYWILNRERFSIRSAFIQNERQLKSAGSFMVRTSISYFKLSSDNGIVPPDLASAYSIDNKFLISGGEFYSLGLAPGYTYTLVLFKKAYINAAVFPGVLWQSYIYDASSRSYSNRNFTLTLSWRAALGYNTDTWYIGAGIVSGFDKVPGWIGNATFYYDIAQIRLWVGTRFNWFHKKK